MDMSQPMDDGTAENDTHHQHTEERINARNHWKDRKRPRDDDITTTTATSTSSDTPSSPIILTGSTTTAATTTTTNNNNNNNKRSKKNSTPPLPDENDTSESSFIEKDGERRKRISPNDQISSISSDRHDTLTTTRTTATTTTTATAKTIPSSPTRNIPTTGTSTSIRTSRTTKVVPSISKPPKPPTSPVLTRFRAAASEQKPHIATATTTTTTTTKTKSTTSTINSEDHSSSSSSSSPLPSCAKLPPVVATAAATASTDTAATVATAADNKSSISPKEDDDTGKTILENGHSKKGTGRWRVHQMAEDYVNLVGNMMYPATKFRSYGYDTSQREYPLEGISALGYLTSPLRRPTIIETWSPYEISLFEASLLHHGKEFAKVSKIIKSKTTKEVIDFYYIWKKTKHYKKWKEQYVPDSELLEMDANNNKNNNNTTKGKT